MVDKLFQSIFTSSTNVDLTAFSLCIITALILGFIIAISHMVKTTYSKGFVMSIALMPAAVCVVILMVNGNVGTGVAVAGAFSLVRFRSLPGTAREISSIFLAMAAGLATGIGYVGFAVLFVIIIAPLQMLYAVSRFGEPRNSRQKRTIRITVPENLNYTTAFDEIFDAFTQSNTLISVKTTNMGSMYRLVYTVVLKEELDEKALIDALRCRNGNLEIASSQSDFATHEL